ncbi:MAG: hypothetical protein AAFW82_01740 [Pseudomonadota bacterium]
MQAISAVLQEHWRWPNIGLQFDAMAAIFRLAMAGRKGYDTAGRTL